MPLNRDRGKPDVDTLEPRAITLAMELRLNCWLAEGQDQRLETQAESPWLLCYLAMEQRIAYADYSAALRLAQVASGEFMRRGDHDGQARALAEVAIARYHLGQYAIALAELGDYPQSGEACCAAALALAAYINYVGINALPEAIQAANQGLGALERAPDARRREAWRVVLQRNLAAAYHYRGELALARRAAEDAAGLVEAYTDNSYLYDWALYERGLLEQRAGRLDLALDLLRGARRRLEQSSEPTPIQNWIAAAEGHALRDMGCLDAADECYRLGGWGEGDDGPLMLCQRPLPSRRR